MDETETNPADPGVEFDHDQHIRALAIMTARDNAKGAFGSMVGGNPRTLIAIAYYIETGIVPEELLVNSKETSGNLTKETYLNPEGKRS